MNRIVLLPRVLDERLDELTKLGDETNGVLLYRHQREPYQRYCPVTFLYVTGKGTPGHVRSDQQRLDVLNGFFTFNPNYGMIKWHTHSRGTLDEFGEGWAYSFSQQDIDFYQGQLEQNPKFIGMVATPRKKLLWAPDEPALQVLNTFPTREAARVARQLEQIKKAKAYNFKNFRSRLK